MENSTIAVPAVETAVQKKKTKPAVLPLLVVILLVAAVFGLNAWRSRAGLNSALAIGVVAGAAVVCVLLLWRVYVLLFQKRAALARVFMPAALALGLLFGLTFPPGVIPDEHAHANAIYLYTNRILGVTDTPSESRSSNVYVAVDTSIRQEDARGLALLTGTPALSAYRTVFAEAVFWYNEEQSQPVPATLIDLGVPPVVYAPAIAGMLLGRTVHLGYYPLVLFSRLCMLLFYVCMTAWALRLLPFGKSALFVTALLPMALHLSCSLSYDAVILALAFASFASVMDMAYGAHTHVTWAQVIRTAVLTALLACCKVGSYLPLVLLALLIPRERFAKRGHRLLLLCSLIAIGLLVCLLWNLDTFTTAARDELHSVLSADTGEAIYTVSYLLANPIATLRVLARTVLSELGTWAYTGIGRALGWLNVPVAMPVILGYAALLLATFLHPADEPLPAIRGGGRLLFLAAPALTLLIFLIGMLIWWTPVSSTIVLGIQGRYFLPVLPCLLLVLPRVTYAGTLHLTRRTTVTLGAQPDRVIAFLAVVLGCLTLAGLYPMIFAR